MKIRAIVLAALAGAMMLPEVAQAQVVENVVVQRGGRGMLGIMTEGVRSGAEPSRQRIIMEVVTGSAAERAGLARGDVILRVNGVAATEQAMGSPFEPGDTVVLRIRRNGQERDVTVVAGMRMAVTPAQGNFTYALPDSVQRQMSVIIRGVRNQLDSMAVQGRIPFMGDSVFTLGRGDSVRIFRFGPDDGFFVNVDSIMTRFMQVPGEMARVFSDSAAIRIFSAPGARPDTVHFLRPAEAMASGFSMGMRSVAGAELAELNPGLAEYFGVMSGVLVVDAREGTPAARAGIRAGDVITRAGDSNITSVAELRRAVAGVPPGQALRLRVLRHGQPVDVTLGR
jgi:membrane-associated protease RseP (regulator of RpoE activity)